jgi:hypothetical protein
MRKELHMDQVDYSLAVGVFRERSQADQAIDELKQIGIREDRIKVREYHLPGAGEVDSQPPQESNQRLIVNVNADGKAKEAVGILFNDGANNADLPHGTKLIHGSLVNSDEANADLKSEQPTGESSADGFFGGKNVGDKF